MGKNEVGKIDTKAIVNALIDPVNVAIVDGKESSKKGSKNKAKMKVQVKGEADMSEVDKAKKEAAKPVETPVKLVLNDSDLKKLNNLPTAKMKIDFLVDKGALSKTIGKDLKSAIQTAYTQMRKKTNADRISQAELDKFIDKVPQLSGQARSSMITELQKKGIPESAYSSYETGYRLRNYVIDAKKSISSRGKFTTPSGSFAVPDISLSAEEYGKSMNELIQNAQNVVAAASFFEKENEKLGKVNPNFTIPTKEDISSAKMKELTGFGVKVDKKNDALNNYANYLSDQFTKKAGVYDIIDQAIAGTLDPSQLDISGIKNSITSSLKTTKSTKTTAAVNTRLAKYVDTYVNKSIEELEKDILNDDLFGKNALPNKINNPKSVAEKISDKMSTRKRNKFMGLMSAYLARNGSGIQNEDFYKSLLNDVLEYAENAKDLSDRKNAIEQAIQKQIEEAKNSTDSSDKTTKPVKKKTVKKTTTKKQESTSTTTSQIEEADNINTSTTSPAASTPKVTKPKSTTKKTTSTKKKAESVAKNAEQKAQELTNEQLGALEGEFMRAYEEYSDAKEAYFSGNLSPFKYINKLVNYRQAYIKASNLIPGDSIQQITGREPLSALKAIRLSNAANNTADQIFGIKNAIADYGYDRKNYPEMFDILDGIGRNIININNMRYNNRKNPNGDGEKIVNSIKTVRTLAGKIEDMVRANGYDDFTLKEFLPTSDKLPEEEKPEVVSKPKATPKKKAVAKKEAKTETPTPVIEEKSAAVVPVVSDENHKKNIQQIKDTEKAKEKEADTVVTANDKIADSEKAVTKQVVNSGKSQEDTIKTVSAIRNKDYDLTETPVTPSELDGLKQLSQKEFGDAEKYVKVYEDTNRTIYTLTQTYQKKFDQNGNLLAEGYKNVISYYDSYEKLESDAIKLSKRINSNYAKLDTERYKSTEKKNPNLIKKLQGDIKSDQQDLSELHRIARLQASNSNNDYTYQDFTQALRKGSAESSRALSSTRRTNRDNFNAQKETVNTDLSKQISDVEGLGQAGEIAASKLKNIQQALSSITTPAGLEDAKKQIEDINKQFDSNKTRESALNYVNNLEKGLTGKQTVSISQKNSDWYENSVKNGEWTGPLADLNKKFEDNRINTISDIDKYIAKAKMLGEVGSDAVSSFTNLRDQLVNVNTESGLEKIQKEMASTQKKLEASKAQAALEEKTQKDQKTREKETQDFNTNKSTMSTDLQKLILEAKDLGEAGNTAAESFQKLYNSVQECTTTDGLKKLQDQMKIDTHNFGLAKKQAELEAKSVKERENQLDKNEKFASDKINTTSQLKGYIADAKAMGSVGEEAAKSFKQLYSSIQECYTDSDLKQIQSQMKETYTALKTAKKEAELEAKNSESAKVNNQFIQIMADMTNLEKKNKELRTALKGDKNADYIKNITAERDAYKQAVEGADEYIDKHKEILGDKAVNKYKTAKASANQVETDIENDIAKQAREIDTQAYTDKYTAAISDVKALGEAYKELNQIQKEAFSSKKSGQSVTTLDDYNAKITEAQNKVKTLTDKVQDFRKNTWSFDATQTDKLNQKIFDNYEKQYDNMSNTKDNYTSDLVEAMKTAYKTKRSAEADLLKKAMNVSLDQGQITDLKRKSSYSSALYSSLRDQVIEQFGKDFQQQAISELKSNSNNQRNDILSTNFKTLSNDISQYVSTVTQAGRASEQFQNVFSGISTDLVNLQNNFSDPSKLNSEGVSEYFDKMNAIAKNFESWKQTFSTGKGKLSLDFTQASNDIYGEKSLDKNANYFAKAKSYVEEYNTIWSKYDDEVKQFAEGTAERNQLTSKAEKEANDTIKKMQDLAKNSEKYNKTTKQGTEIDWTANRTQNTKDASAFLSEYAKSIGLTSEISSKINESTGQVQKTFVDISGNTVTLTGNIDKVNSSLRVMQSLVSKNSTGMTSFGNTIKGMVSGNFKGAIADIASYVSYFQVTMKAIQSAKEGFNTFLDYEKDLTNISYTMNMSPSQLQDLGSSAVDMAKDLSMSLDNTMDIYKIYANMNTTASEIQETAKPTAILSNLSGVDASTAADQVQGILQQFHMLEDGSTTAADASMHIVDVLDKVSGSVGIDYAKGIKIISDAVQASGQVAYDAGMSYEQLAAITAKVSERTREDGSSIGNALKTNKLSLRIEICAM